MNIWLFILLFALAWIMLGSFIWYMMIREWADPLFPKKNGRGSILWLITSAIVLTLAIWGSVASIKQLYFPKYEEQIRSGFVRDRQYDPPYTSHGFIMSGKVMVPTTHYHPPRYWLLVDGKSQTGSKLRDWVDVGQNTYESFSDGDSIYFKPAVQ